VTGVGADLGTEIIQIIEDYPVRWTIGSMIGAGMRIANAANGSSRTPCSTRRMVVWVAIIVAEQWSLTGLHIIPFWDNI
jgi:hypothetical protein